MIEGQLKEKSGGKWRIFRKWKSRYFTLSGKYIFKLRFYCLKENEKKINKILLTNFFENIYSKLRKLGSRVFVTPDGLIRT